MVLNSSVFLKKTALLFFILLFPGFFFYHYSVSRMLIPPFLGGYFSPVAVCAFLLLMLLGWRFYFYRFNNVSFIFFLILIFNLMVSALNYYFGSPFGYVKDMFFWSLTGLLFNIVMFMIGRHLDFRVNRVYVFTLIAMCAVVILNIGDTGIFHVRLESDSEVSETITSYQGFGRSLLVLSLAMSAYTFGRGRQFYMIFIISIVALFFNGARTEFSVYLATVFLIFLIYSVKRPSLILKMIAVLMVLVPTVLFYVDYIPSSRMFQLFDLATSSSGQGRSMLFSWSVSEVFSSLESTIVGSYGAYTSLGGVGSYPHNIFSAWINFGFVGFFLYVVMFGLMWSYAALFFSSHMNSSLYKTFLFFLICVTISLIVSKDYSYMLVGFTVGLYAQFCSGLVDRKQSHREVS